MVDPSFEITALLNQHYDGKEGALDQVMEVVYADFRKIASRHLRAKRSNNDPGGILEPSDLVNETFLKLIKQRKRYDNRGHFFAIATRIMLRVLLDHTKSQNRLKRGGGQVRVSLSEVQRKQSGAPDVGIPELVEALEELDILNKRSAEVSKLRLIWGLTNREVAEALDVSTATAEREWSFSRKWLSTALKRNRE